jgi:hypothetical protein
MQRRVNDQGIARRAILTGAAAMALAPLAWAQCPGLSFTQSTDLVANGSTVSCGIADQNANGCGEQTPQGYARAFAKGLNGTPTGAITVTGVQWTVFRNDYAGIPVRINVYLDQDGRGTGANTPGVDCVLMNSTVVAGLAATSFGPPCTDAPFNVSTTLSRPVVWPDGCDLWVEIENPEDGTVTTNGKGDFFTFRPSSNAGGQSAPTYFRPPQGSCGSVGAWIDVATIGFPNTHLKMQVCYTASGAGSCPTGPDGACVPSAGDCCIDNGGPGCDSYDICNCVCAGAGNDPFCCDTLWDNTCAQEAQQACGLFCPVDAPPRLFEGSAGPGVSNFEVSPDDFGSVNSNTFVPLNYQQGGDWNDSYNGTEVSFTNGFVYYNAGRNERQMLSFNPNWLDVGPDDGSCDLDLVSAAVGSDTNADSVNDRSVSSFDLTGDLAAPNDTDLSITVTNQVDTSLANDNRASWTQTYAITNNSPNAISFNLLRQFDVDLLFDPEADFADDEVGTNNAACDGDVFVFQREVGDDDTAITLSSANANIYVGSKGGADPDGAGAGVAMGFGTDVQEWQAYGIPSTWNNMVAAVPACNEGMVANTDGASGNPIGCTPDATEDCHILLNIPVSLAGGASTSVTIRFTYGSIVPTGVNCDAETPEPCCLPSFACQDLTPTACATAGGTAAGQACRSQAQGDNNGDGSVTATDLSNLILAWGSCPGCPEDTNGDNVITAVDLSNLIIGWGPCP